MTVDRHGESIVLGEDYLVAAPVRLDTGAEAVLVPTTGRPIYPDPTKIVRASEVRPTLAHEAFYETDHVRTNLAEWASYTASGAGVYVVSPQYVNTPAKHPGVVRHDTSTTSGAYCGTILCWNGLYVSGQIILEGEVCLNNTATAAFARFGLGNDVVGADHTNGVYFEFDQATSSAWRIVTASSSSRTKTTTAVTASTATWFTMRIEVNAAATSVAFYIDDVLVGTHTTNIPTANTQPVGVHCFARSGAASSFWAMDVDWVRLRYRSLAR